MAETISWLHLTDLHLGLDNQSWLWPRVKHDLFKDLEKLVLNTGGWDLVFFTGDFTQSGKKEEFEKLNSELEELWKILGKNGSTPRLCKVPGNHDLVRPENSAISKAISQLWWNDPSLRMQFWKEPDCEYRKAINSCFENYNKWASQLQVPSLPIAQGILPGDFSAIFPKGKIKIGIVGLNSTFLQITSGDYKGKLDLHISQLNSVCGGDPEKWFRDKSLNLLLTHQPPGWLSKESLHHYRQEIYPPGRFFAHLCGHEHASELIETKEGGDSPRRLRQGPSIFGLEKWDEVNPKKRSHGYTAGQFIFEPSESFEKFWPRIAIDRRSGGLNLSPDYSYSLKEGDCVITEFELQNDIQENKQSQLTVETTSPQKAELTESFNLLQSVPDQNAAKQKLAACARFTVSFGPQHRFVRLEEQSQFENDLRKSRCEWLIADWGVGKEGFIGSVLERFKTEAIPHEVFHLRCDDAADVDAIESLFPQQFAMPLQTFCSNAASLDSFFLIFDDVHSNICTGENVKRFQRLLNAVLDYCPKSRLIIVSRAKPDEPEFPLIELNPLESPDVRVYLSNHRDAPAELQEAEAIEKIFEASEGLPMHIDRILRELKVASLSSVLESDLEGSSRLANIQEVTPKALVDAVGTLSKSQDNLSKRSFRMLKVLSVLPYGETVEMLKHYLPSEPFFNNNALQLSNLDLLDIISLGQSSPNISGGINIPSVDAPKILKVPRQVRDYVKGLISDDEVSDIVYSGLEKYFGRGWREGKIKLRSVPPEYSDYVSNGPGNEFALIHYLIKHSDNKKSKKDRRRATGLAVYYCRRLKSAGRYRDLSLVSGALLPLIDRDECSADWGRLSNLLGEGIRMNSLRYSEAIKHQRSALEIAESELGNEEKGAIWLEIALTEESQNNKDEAIQASEKVKEFATPGSPHYLQAETIIALMTLKGKEKKEKLMEYEKLARDKGFKILADNIAIDLAGDEELNVDKLKQYDKVLENKSSGYNLARAIVSKVEELQSKNQPVQLSQSDFLRLSAAYSYLHAQRFGSFFNRCHNALWQVLELRGETAQLLRLFRHTSFLWRIRGEDKKEAEYIERLNSKGIAKDPSSIKGVVLELGYYMKRLRLIVVKITTSVKPLS